MRVYCCQVNTAWENKNANHSKVRALLTPPYPPARSLFVLPEMFATGFSMNVEGINDTESQETQQFLSTTARKFGIYMLGGLVTTSPDGKGRNMSVVYGPDGNEVTRYQKLHPFTHGRERDHFTAGSSIVTFDWCGFKVAPFICYDLRFPEIFRISARMGVNLFVVIANWPAQRNEHWKTLLRARAIENQAYVVGTNRCGSDSTHRYSGHSAIISPRGQKLVEAGEIESIISADLDLDELVNYREGFPVLKDIHDEFFPVIDNQVG